MNKDKENRQVSKSAVDGLVMPEYSQGVCEDGAAILKDGQRMTIEQILLELRSGALVKRSIALPPLDKGLIIPFSITPENNIPAFAGYLSGSVKEPEAKVVVNIEAMVNVAADRDNEISFEEIFTTSVVHEMLHAVQEIYKREFDEEEVEKVLADASEIFYES